MKIRKNKRMYQKNVMKTNLLIYQSTVFFQYFKRFSKKKILSCTVTFYIVKKKHFCRYCLQAFSIEDILKPHIKDFFKINGKQRIMMPKKVNTLNSEIMKEK